jgi:hypothetical protein
MYMFFFFSAQILMLLNGWFFVWWSLFLLSYQIYVLLTPESNHLTKNQKTSIQTVFEYYVVKRFTSFDTNKPVIATGKPF